MLRDKISNNTAVLFNKVRGSIILCSTPRYEFGLGFRVQHLRGSNEDLRARRGALKYNSITADLSSTLERLIIAHVV